MRILIAAGGSGGHIFPAVALAQELKDKKIGIDILFIGSNKVLDRRIFEKEGFRYALLSANKLPYKATPGLLLFAIKFLFDILKSFIIIASYRPSRVVGFGGYVSGPVMIAASILRIPSIVHEQNVVPGRANSFSFRLADKIAISFEDTAKSLGPFAKKIIFTGNPIRISMLKNDRLGGMNKLGLNNDKFTILVIGGSQGAHFLNSNFINALAGLDEDTKRSLQVVHITGIKDYEWVRSRYDDLGIASRVYSFIDRIEDAYSASDLVVTRSGASAIFEVAFYGRPMILVPYPFALAHQTENARVFSQKGAAMEINEKEISPEVFKERIAALLNDKGKMREMGEKARSLSFPRSSEVLAAAVLNLVKG